MIVDIMADNGSGSRCDGGVVVPDPRVAGDELDQDIINIFEINIIYSL